MVFGGFGCVAGHEISVSNIYFNILSWDWLNHLFSMLLIKVDVVTTRMASSKIGGRTYVLYQCSVCFLWRNMLMIFAHTTLVNCCQFRASPKLYHRSVCELHSHRRQGDKIPYQEQIYQRGRHGWCWRIRSKLSSLEQALRRGSNGEQVSELPTSGLELYPRTIVLYQSVFFPLKEWYVIDCCCASCLAFAQGWALNARKDEAIRRILIDPHSPPNYRGNSFAPHLGSRILTDLT